MCATRLSGKLNGLIAPTIPIGSRSVRCELALACLGCVHGDDLAGELARLDGRNVYVDIARLVSTLAALSGLPASAEIWAAISS